MKLKLIITTFTLIFSFSTFAREETAQRDMSRLLESEKNTISIFKTGVKSVVNVSNVKHARTSWFSANISKIPFGVGSGFIWDNKGHIVTNYHYAVAQFGTDYSI